MNQPRHIELLAPARNADIAIEAIKHGADAVYLGAASHGARAAASNSTADIARAVDFAHQFRCRVYVTLNTLVYPEELKSVVRLVHDLYRIGVDALIVQDMSLLRLDLPPIALHASTQCDIRTPEKARFLADVGFSQLVLPREMTLDEMAGVHSAVPVTPLEAFVHGALCVSYSGDCQAGYVTQGRSANRGECPQICRHAFDLVDSRGNTLIANRHLLSLRDLNRSAEIDAMLNAGISSFKIEGRLKDMAYVKNTVAAYRELLDRAIDRHPDLYHRASIGHSDATFTPDLCESFNRGFTTYFTSSPRPSAPMASFLTPKWTGPRVGQVISSTPRGIKAKLTAPLANGDGLGYFDKSGRFTGFRANRVEGNLIVPATRVDLPPGTILYRNHNRLLDERLNSDTASRTIDVRITLRESPGQAVIDISDTFGHSCTVARPLQLTDARTPQTDAHGNALRKTGQSIFRVIHIDDRIPHRFIPLSLLTALRRQATETLERTIRSTHPFDRRRPENPAATWPGNSALTYHDNVANPLAEAFYHSHGVTDIELALEAAPTVASRQRIMTSRYCLRRETGHCLLTPGGREWPDELYLVSGPNRFRLHFDCHNCRMHLLTP